MKKIILAVLLLVVCSDLFAQVTVYRTFKEYERGKGEPYDDFDKWLTGATLNKVKYIFIKNGEKETILNTEMWGFKYKDVLFRIFPLNKEWSLGKVMSTGKVTYYEFGWEHLRLAQKGKPEGKKPDITIYPGYSIGLNDEPFFGYFRIKKKDKDLEAFKAANPEHKTIYNCLEGKLEILEIRACFNDYNKKE